MAKPDDKPTSFKERLQQAIPGATSPEMKDALAKMVSPEMKQALREMAQRFQGEPDQSTSEPAAAAARSSVDNAEPTAPTASAATAAPTPTAPLRERHGRQIDRVLRVLRERYPPEGKVPRDAEIDTVRGQVARDLSPENEAKGLGEPSWKVVKAAIEILGRRDD